MSSCLVVRSSDEDDILSQDNSESVGQILESSLFAATSNDDIFDDEYSSLDSVASFDSEFGVDNDLFEELTPSLRGAVTEYDFNQDDIQLLTDNSVQPEFIDLTVDDFFNIEPPDESSGVENLTTVQSYEVGLNEILDDTVFFDSTELSGDEVVENAVTEDIQLDIIETESDLMPDSEFAALEALLGNSSSVTSTVDANYNAAGANNIDIVSEFGDLEKMLATSDSIGGSSNNGSNVIPSRVSRRTTARFEQLMKVSVKHLDDMSNKGRGVGC
ncbi:hypothetical protein RIVM261_051230 [Rivularia sp. IAM M-261]|nr:hypothetical protein RIVM261_051230 [Rivularia sp. IAM M-261]